MTGPDDIPCQELVELVTAYLDGALDETIRTRVEVHLVACAGCENYVDQVRRTVGATAAVAPDEVAPEQLGALLDAFRGWHRRSLEEW